MDKEVKLVRLRDIVVYHLKRHEGTHETTLGQLDALEHDIVVWVKNFLITAESLHAKIEIDWVGDNNEDKESLHTK